LEKKMLFQEETAAETADPRAGSRVHVAYPGLIDRICEINKTVPEPGAHERCELTIDGTRFTLVPMAVDEKKIVGLTYYADIAPMPQGNEREAMAIRLLETNVFLTSREAPSFCIDPRNGHALLAGCMALEALTPESAHNYLRGVAVYAGGLRESQFAPEDIPSSLGPSPEAREPRQF
jgi:hypothetical protein